AYRLDRSYQWNYSHAPALPKVRHLAQGQGGRLLGRPVNSRLGIASGPLLNSKWIEAYARLGFDILTYSTVRSAYRPAHVLPNIRPVDNLEQAAVVARRSAVNGNTTIAISLGEPSMEPDVWRKDVRRARERIGSGQLLIVSVMGSTAFEGAGRERAEVVGAQTFEVASRQVEELLSWRKAGAWDRAILAVGGISTVERATWLLREGADAALVATAALFDPLIATRFRQALSTAVA